MPIKVPNEGERFLLGRLAAAITQTGPIAIMRLFKNDLTPGDDTELADFTEADFSGYLEAPLDGNAVDPDPDGGGRAVCEWSNETFTHDGGGTSNTVYGYYVTDQAGTELWWAERFSSPLTFAVAGDAVTITPRLTLKSEN